MPKKRRARGRNKRTSSDLEDQIPRVRAQTTALEVTDPVPSGATNYSIRSVTHACTHTHNHTHAHSSSSSTKPPLGAKLGGSAISTSSGEHTDSDDDDDSNNSYRSSEDDHRGTAAGDTNYLNQSLADQDALSSLDTDPDEVSWHGDATNIYELYDAALEGRDQDAIRILEAEPSLASHCRCSGPSDIELDWLQGMISQKGDTPLHSAARAGRISTARQIVRFIKGHSRPYSDISMNLLGQGNKDGDTPLHIALKNKHLEVAKYLIEERPEVAYQVNKTGVSPLFLAIFRGYMDLVEAVFLLCPGMFVSDSKKVSLLQATQAPIVHAALNKEDFEVLRKVLHNLPELIESMDTDGWRPLSRAAFDGYLKGVQYILKEFPDSVKKSDKDGFFPIHKAVDGGHNRIVKEMILRFPETKFQKAKSGQTLLDTAHGGEKYRLFAHLRRLPDFNKIVNISLVTKMTK